MANSSNRERNWIVFLIIGGLLFVVVIFTDSFQYLFFKSFIWESFFAWGAVFGLGAALWIYWYVIKKRFHYSIRNSLAFWILFPVAFLITYLCIFLALLHIENFYFHISAILFYFLTFMGWDWLIFKKGFSDNIDFQNYARELFEKNDKISFFGIAIIFLICIIYENFQRSIKFIKINDECVRLTAILMGGVIGFQLFMRFLTLIKSSKANK